MRSGTCLLIALALASLAVWTPAAVDAQTSTAQPLDVARALAARYPQSASRSYIPALSWRAALRLSQLTGEDRWAEKARADMRPFLEREEPAMTDPYRLTDLAVLAAFSDLGEVGNGEASALARRGADLLLQADGDGPVPFATGWTDDMFMATSLLVRVGAHTDDPAYGEVVGRLLATYADRLQRADGLFVHSADGPHAWGRGNGFAALGLVEALTYLPGDWAYRAPVLDIYRRQMQSLLAHQSSDGSWHQIIDHPESYRELTVTATVLVAMARGIRLGWLERSEYLPAVERAWGAVASRIGEDGSVRDVCTSTGAGPTLEYYLERPVVSGFDDRGGGLALLAAVEMEELRSASQ